MAVLTEATKSFVRLRDSKHFWVVHPIMAFIITRLVVFISGYLGEIALPTAVGEGFWHAAPDNIFLDIWARFDSGFYLDIVDNGYSYILGEQSSVAFFPLYPLSVSIANLAFNNSVLSGIVVSHVYLLGGLIYLYALTKHIFKDDMTAQRAVYYIAAFPTSLFFSAVYTESTFFFFSIVTVYYAKTEQWGWASLFAMLTTVSRIVGLVVWGIVGLEWLASHGWTLLSGYKKSAWKNMWHGLRTDWFSLSLILLAPLGILTHMFFLYTKFDDPIAFMTVQSAWGRENLGPIGILVRDLVPVFSQNFALGQIWWHVILDTICFFFALGLVYHVWKYMGEGLAIFTILGVLIPSISSTQSMTRYVLVLFPLFMVLAHWGKNNILDRALTTSFLVFLGLFTAAFVNWVFVA